MYEEEPTDTSFISKPDMGFIQLTPRVSGVKRRGRETELSPLVLWTSYESMEPHLLLRHAQGQFYFGSCPTGLQMW